MLVVVVAPTLAGMGNEKSELEKLIDQAQEMVGEEGSIWLAFESARYRHGLRWTITLQTSQGWKVQASELPTPDAALNEAIRRLLEKAGSAGDEAHRLLSLSQRRGE